MCLSDGLITKSFHPKSQEPLNGEVKNEKQQNVLQLLHCVTVKLYVHVYTLHIILYNTFRGALETALTSSCLVVLLKIFSQLPLLPRRFCPKLAWLTETTFHRFISLKRIIRQFGTTKKRRETFYTSPGSSPRSPHADRFTSEFSYLRVFSRGSPVNLMSSVR